MAFILIKINDISTAKLLLSKANEYNRLCEESKKVSHSSKGNNFCFLFSLNAILNNIHFENKVHLTFLEFIIMCNFK